MRVALGVLIALCLCVGSLAQSGPLRRLEGSSGWRTFVLPFFNREGGPPPDRLVLNLVLTGAGTVDIGPLELVQLAAGEDPLAGAVAWWGGRQAGLFGAVAGSTLGPGAEYLIVFRVTSTVTFAGYALAIWHDWIWYSRNLGYTVRSTIDGLVYGLLTGGAFGWLWP